jgi:hypothetical protein
MDESSNRSPAPAAGPSNGRHRGGDLKSAPVVSRRLREKPEPRAVRTINDWEVRSGHIQND